LIPRRTIKKDSQTDLGGLKIAKVRKYLRLRKTYF
jgi:hypothetical protein